MTNAQVESVSGGEEGLNLIRYRDRKTGNVTEYRAPDGDRLGVFVFAGYEPATGLVQGLAELNEQGYVIADRQQKIQC